MVIAVFTFLLVFEMWRFGYCTYSPLKGTEFCRVVKHDVFVSVGWYNISGASSHSCLKLCTLRSRIRIRLEAQILSHCLCLVVLWCTCLTSHPLLRVKKARTVSQQWCCVQTDHCEKQTEFLGSIIEREGEETAIWTTEKGGVKGKKFFHKNE